jgi:transcriptional regulator with XRE-family HTH domain
MALITSDQIRAARSLLRISVNELASKSGIGVATIKRIEATSGIPATHARTLNLLEIALIDFGIEFIGTPDDRPGVRLK